MPESEWEFGVYHMNRVHVAIVRGDTVEDWLKTREVPPEGRAEVMRYWASLKQELSRPLPKGQVWDVGAD